MTGEKKIVGLWRDAAAKPESNGADEAAPADVAAPESAPQPEAAEPVERDWLDMSALAETEDSDMPGEAEASSAFRDRIAPVLLILLALGWTIFALAAATGGFARAPALADLVQLDDEGFRAFFSASPVKRIGHARFIRNVLIAIGNSGDPGLAVHARARLTDPQPLIRGAAIWAVRRLLPETEAEALRLAFFADEGDMSVQAEWSAAVQPARAQ